MGVAYEVNGVLVACEVRGPAGGAPVVLLHALGEDRSSWAPVAEALAADGWRTYAVDLRGHGESGHPGAYAYEDMRDDVLALMDELGLDRVTLVAHSMGTVPASLIAMDRPHAVRRLVLEEGPLPFPAEPRRPVPDGPDGPTPYDWRVVPGIAVQRNDPPARHWDGLAEITAPTLLIAGGPRSHLRQDQLAKAADRIPGARLTTIDAGHMVHDERPAEFLAVLRDFLGAPPTEAGEPPAAFAPFRVGPAELRAAAGEFADLLTDSVDSGACVGFRSPFTVRDATGWWLDLAPAVAERRVQLWAVRDDAGRIRGAVRLHREDVPGSRHRAWIRGLMVHGEVRGRGLARALLRAAEAGATADGVRLLLLDVLTGSPADGLFRAEGWTPAGTVPDHTADPEGVLRPATFFFKRLP